MLIIDQVDDFVVINYTYIHFPSPTRGMALPTEVYVLFLRNVVILSYSAVFFNVFCENNSI